MEPEQAADQIQNSAKEIAVQLMQIHPAVAKLGNEKLQGTILTSLHKITVELEIVKKQLIVFQQRDDSAEL